MPNPLTHHPADRNVQDLYRGCLLGGAVGDALGAPVEFMSMDQITRTFGPSGIQEYVPAFGKLGAITDDTQMTLFTAEGLMRAWVRGNLRGLCRTPGVIAHAYQRWLHTQGHSHALHATCLDGWLLGHGELFSRRSPGITCLSGLQDMRQSNDLADNNSKGCGGIMRVAPIGMYFATLARHNPLNPEQLLGEAFELGCEAAAITHGHPTGQLASGTFAAIVMQLLKGMNLPQAIDSVLPLLAGQPHHEETMHAVQTACHLSRKSPGNADALVRLGGGWIAEEALAIAVYCALSADDLRTGVVLAVNHGGDSDSTGSMAGQLLGAMYGVRAIPDSWIRPLELRAVIETMSDDLVTFNDWFADAKDGEDIEASRTRRYPGS